MGNHRAQRGPGRDHSAAPVAGRRKAQKQPALHPFFRALPSAPIVAGVAALALSAGGAVSVADTHLVGTVTPPSSSLAAASRATIANLAPLRSRDAIVSRDSRRDATTTAASKKLVAQAEAQAKQQHAALQQFAKAADKQSAKIKENQWGLPVDSYRITATFGMSSYLWSSVHTGLDFAGPTGTPIHAIANGVVTAAGYDGSYGNKTVVTLADGTELWYCHQTSILVSVGEAVQGGQTIGTIGSTGNVTGPHLHLEVRPGGGDPVDPFTALIDHGLSP